MGAQFVTRCLENGLIGAATVTGLRQCDQEAEVLLWSSLYAVNRYRSAPTDGLDTDMRQSFIISIFVIDLAAYDAGVFARLLTSDSVR